MKKLLTVCLILSLIFGIFGCGTTPTDETLITRAKELLPKTEELNDLLYITGIPLDPTASETNGYQKADGEYLKEKGITKISDVFSKMKGIWSEDYIERFKKSSLVTSVVERSRICKDTDPFRKSPLWCACGYRTHCYRSVLLCLYRYFAGAFGHGSYLLRNRHPDRPRSKYRYLRYRYAFGNGS